MKYTAQLPHMVYSALDTTSLLNLNKATTAQQYVHILQPAAQTKLLMLLAAPAAHALGSLSVYPPQSPPCGSASVSQTGEWQSGLPWM